jgi:hypothetical protein
MSANTLETEFTPLVNAAREFAEISRDFTNPLEVFREAVHNSLDAGATAITLSAQMESIGGEERLVIECVDNGAGMDSEDMHAFFGLGFSRKSSGEGVIGYKGHGTKIYYDSRRLETASKKSDSEVLFAYTDGPRAALLSGKLPTIRVRAGDDNQLNKMGHGTRVRIVGYNSDQNERFSTHSIHDYLLWFTKFGSFEDALFPDRKARWKTCAITIRGVNYPSFETVKPGHHFAAECFTLKQFSALGIKEDDRGKYFCRHWPYKGVPIKGRADVTLDVFISVEGDWARRQANPWLRYQGRRDRQGLYTAQERYGLYVAKDYIPITRVNDWAFQTSEWTRFHGFINCQKFDLTANRGSVENTKQGLLPQVKDTVKSLVDEILDSDEYGELLEHLNELKVFRRREGEDRDFGRRKSLLDKRRIATLDDGTELIEPRQEQGVFALFTIVATKYPKIFPFRIVDYDTHQGYDALVTTSDVRIMDRAVFNYVEFKYKLGAELNHSFNRLSTIVCWDLQEGVGHDSQVRDLVGEERILKVERTDETFDGRQTSYTSYWLDRAGAAFRIQVFVLKDFLRERLNLHLRQRGSTL